MMNKGRIEAFYQKALETFRQSYGDLHADAITEEDKQTIKSVTIEYIGSFDTSYSTMVGLHMIELIMLDFAHLTLEQIDKYIENAKIEVTEKAVSATRDYCLDIIHELGKKYDNHTTSK